MADDPKNPNQTPAPAAAAAADVAKPPEGYKQTENVDPAITASIDALLDVADDLNDEKKALGEKVAANRNMLRGFLTQNLATDEQAGEIVKRYAPREKKD